MCKAEKHTLITGSNNQKSVKQRNVLFTVSTAAALATLNFFLSKKSQSSTVIREHLKKKLVGAMMNTHIHFCSRLVSSRDHCRCLEVSFGILTLTEHTGLYKTCDIFSLAVNVLVVLFSFIFSFSRSAPFLSRMLAVMRSRLCLLRLDSLKHYET